MGSVLVIGSGVIGASCAYFLARDGWQVTIIDQGDFGRGCSHGNCGFVCPSHVLPLAMPGAVRAGVKALFSPNSAFSIKPRLSPALWGWLYRFTRRCKTTDMIAAGRAIQALLNSSRQLYPDLLKQETIECEWEERGLYYVFQHTAAMDHHAETEKLLRQEFNMPGERVEGEELILREPALKPGLAGAYYYSCDAHLRPDKLMAEWRRVLEKYQVRIQINSAVAGLKVSGNRAKAALLLRPKPSWNLTEAEADAFVIATGAWTPSLSKEIGCRIPIQPGKGYSITMPRPARCPAGPLIFEEHRVAVTPMQSGYRLGSTMEFAGYDRSIQQKRLALLREGARPYLHEPTCEPVEEEWYGWRPMTPDSLPVIDRSPACANVFIAAGHNMLGLSMAPATGKLTAELLGNRTPHIDPTPYRVSRF